MAGFRTSVPKGFKEKAKPTSPDEAGKTTIRKSKNIPKDMGSRVKEESNIEIERQKRPYY